jgi:hypothetical protein
MSRSPARRVSGLGRRCDLESWILAAAMATTLLSSACAVRLRYYDEDHRDYHYWDAREDRAYRHYLRERHEVYSKHEALSREQQREYWRWRHEREHADRDDD